MVVVQSTVRHFSVELPVLLQVEVDVESMRARPLWDFGLGVLIIKQRLQRLALVGLGQVTSDALRVERQMNQVGPVREGEIAFIFYLF